MKPVIKLALVSLVVVGLGYAYSATEQPQPPPPPPPLPDGAAYTVKTWYVGGGEAGESLPLVIVMPADDSTAEEAMKNLKLDKPARVITIEGRFSALGKFYWIDPKLKPGPEYGQAVKDELERLVNVVKGLVKEATPARAVLLGYGFAGAMAIGLAFRLPELIRQAWGTGGTVEMSWVPGMAPLLGELKTPMMRKLSWREPGYEEAVAAKARSRGFDMEVKALLGQPNDELVSAWLMKDFEGLLGTP